MPTCLLTMNGVPSARTYWALVSPQLVPLASWQRSMARAAFFGSGSSSASASSQVGAMLSTVPSQSSSAGTGRPPSAPGSVTTTSIAPGFTLGSQSLQSPSITVNPSLSLSSVGPETQSPGIMPPVPVVAGVKPPVPLDAPGPDPPVAPVVVAPFVAGSDSP